MLGLLSATFMCVVIMSCEMSWAHANLPAASAIVAMVLIFLAIVTELED